MLVDIAKAAEMLGVSKQYLRTVDEDRLTVIRTKGGHRRYDYADVLRLAGKLIDAEGVSQKAVIYSRVSSQDQKQKGDLDRQKLRNMEYCVANKLEIVETLEECSSGMNDNRPKLRRIVALARDKIFSKLIIEHKDRLTRFNFNMYTLFFESLGVEVVTVEQTLPKTYENELVEDMLSLLQSFSSKIYGRRSHKNRENAKKKAGGGDADSA